MSSDGAILYEVEMNGYLFEVPPVLMQGCWYLPLVSDVLLPGATISILTNDAQMEALFRELKARDDVLVIAKVREDANPASAALHPVGCLAIVAEMIEDAQGRLFTVFAGVGRVVVGDPFMRPGESFPRMDVSPVLSTVSDTIDAKIQLSTFRSVVAGLGHDHAEVVNALHQYAASSEDLSVVVDRLSGLVGLGQVAFLQSILESTDVLDRFALLQDQTLDFMARIKASKAQLKN